MAGELSGAALLRWVDGYEQAWRTAGTASLADLFAADAVYLSSPYAEPVVGLPAIAEFWEAERDGPDEVFTMSRDVVSCSGSTGVVRVQVRYGAPVRQEYLDLWVVSFGADGLARRFEEWPFWPTHGRAPVDSGPVVVPTSSVVSPADGPDAPYAEWVRSPTLSSGVYRLRSGASDDQRPHFEDEVYVVTAGAGQLEVDGVRHAVSAGSLAFVPRRAAHRFVDIVSDLDVVVVFAPPESG